ncbi:MAG: ABC transporter ATP-binding protein [Sulfuricella denitrificans]|nr:ABC transporter ATP-binding protein [Sulfuricella denitrificans]
MAELLPSLRARNLSRCYGKRMALEALDLELHPGEVMGLLGQNGAGKSTTMRMLTGNLAPGSGSIEVCGIDLCKNPEAAKMHLGYLPEIPPLYQEMTVSGFLRLAASLHRVPKSGMTVAVAQTLQRCDLTGVSKRLIGNLSKGYRQRVGIAQAIIHSPAVVILDEPTAGLDPLQIREIRALIAELGRSHSVILSTHFLPEAEALCNRVLILRRGRTVFSGQVSDLLKQCTDDTLEDCFVRLTGQGNAT